MSKKNDNMKTLFEMFKSLVCLKKKYFLLLAMVAILQVPKAEATSTSQYLTSEQREHYWKAVKLFESDEYAKALLYFQHILDENSGNCELNYYVGMCYYKLNRVKLSARYFEIAKEDSKCNVKILILARGSAEQNLYSAL